MKQRNSPNYSRVLTKLNQLKKKGGRGEVIKNRNSYSGGYNEGIEAAWRVFLEEIALEEDPRDYEALLERLAHDISLGEALFKRMKSIVKS